MVVAAAGLQLAIGAWSTTNRILSRPPGYFTRHQGPREEKIQQPREGGEAERAPGERFCGDEPAMGRPRRGARSRPALRRERCLSPGSTGLRGLVRPGGVPASVSGKDTIPAWRALQRSRR